MSFSYRKFPDGSWTIVGPDTLAPGTVATVTTRNGKTKTETVRERLLTLEDGRHVYRVEPRKAESKTDDTKAELLSALIGVLQHCVTVRGFPDKDKGRTEDQQQAFDAAMAAIRKAESGQ